MSNPNIQSVLANFTGALSSLEAAKAAIHQLHIKLENNATDAIGGEASAALSAVNAASKLGVSALVSELALTGVSYGVVNIDANDAKAEIAEIDNLLAGLEAALKALDLARATIDTAVGAEHTRALTIRASLSGIVDQAQKS